MDITIGNVMNGPMPTMSIILIAVAWASPSFLSSFISDMYGSLIENGYNCKYNATGAIKICNFKTSFQII